MPEKQFDAVLTLTEAASYLRVPKEELLQLAEQREIPAQQIGGEWRFLKRGLKYWLVYGQALFRDSPPFFLDHTILNELLFAIEQKLVQRIDPENALARTMPVMKVHQESVTTCTNGDADREPPIADFMEPVEYGWTEAGFEARQALKKYCEETHADY